MWNTYEWRDIEEGVRRAFNRTFILEFIHKNRRGPKCKLKENAAASDDFKKLISRKPLGINEYDLTILPELCRYLDFEPELIFDDFRDFTELLLDKSPSPYLDNWYTALNKDATKQIHTRGREESKRLLIEILRRGKFSCCIIVPWDEVLFLNGPEECSKFPSSLYALPDDDLV